MSNKLCIKCNHFLTIHHDENGQCSFQCWERNSYENNDFCGCTEGKPPQILSDNKLELYVVKNTNGLYFRAKGYGGYGNNWVEKISSAKIYTKLSQARARVTFFNNNYKEFPAPVIIVLEVKEINVLEESERLNKVKLSKELKVINKKKSSALLKLKKAQDELNLAERELKNIK